MIESVLEYCLKNRFIVILAAVALFVWGVITLRETPVDALPDLSDNQVIIYTPWAGQAPLTVEDQVTYPLETAMMGLPHVKDVRGQSFYGFSLIYVIFDDSVDIYWARSRVLERLASSQGLIPPGVTPQLGPDGTGVGHVLWYIIKGEGKSLADLRSIQDYYIRYQLAAVDGVSECASVGGFVREYQVDLDPDLLRKYGVTSSDVVNAIKMGNGEVGARVLEQSDQEYYIRGRGYVESIEDIGNIVIKATMTGVPVLVKHVAKVQLGTDMRRGLLELNGEEEVVGGIIVMRFGENAKAVIDRVKEKIKEVERGLPEGMSIEIVHDRSALIEKAIDHLKHTLFEEIIVVIIVVLVFLLDWRGSLVITIAMPLAVLAGFIVLRQFGLNANIMSLMGIAITIGVIVDDGIVLVENAHRWIVNASDGGKRTLTYKEKFEAVRGACIQIRKALLFTPLIVLTSFVPVFLLTGQEGKLFIPLALTKSGLMLASAFLAITFKPVLLTFIMGRRARPDSANPITRFFDWLYAPLVRGALKFGWLVIAASFAIVALTYPIYKKLGTEFMPNLNEGELVYMPVTMPGITTTEAKRLLQLTDKIMMQHPQVARVLGKDGRAETATDPAPMNMIETFVQFTPEETWPKGKTINDIRSELDAMLKVPGLQNGWTMPIINRIQMLATGVRTDVGIKIYGNDLDTLARLSLEAEKIAKGVNGAVDVFAERVMGGRYINIKPDREKAARYGLNVGDVQMVIDSVLGGMAQTTTVEGRERYGIRVRYARDFRDNTDRIMDTLVPTMDGGQIPLRMVADVYYEDGPPMVSSENGMLRSLVYLNIRGRDMGSTVNALDKALSENLELPEGYYYRLSGQWENLVRARARLAIILPFALVIIFVLLYFTFGNFTDTMIVMLSVPFAFIGGVWLLAWHNMNISVAVWVGFIALFGLAVSTGVLMVVYLEEAFLRVRDQNGGVMTPALIFKAAYEGAALRLRPKLMTVATSVIALFPIMYSHGTGSEVMKPICVPLIGGLLSSTVLVLIVIPVLYAWARIIELKLGITYETKSGMKH
ncbi:MAG: efflux RND transporter permease subunit [bacterium]|jgi:Cu(I)/Ag(I) efflux system membrane protein CusA/SilA